MPRWLRLIRGTIGTGLTFAVGVGALASIVGGLAWLGGKMSGVDVLRVAGRLSVVGFLLGIAFSGILILTARGRQFGKLSLGLVSALGAGAGLAYYAFLAMNGGRHWSPQAAIVNFVLLIVMGAGSSTATVLIARRSRSALKSSDELQSLNSGEEPR